MTGAAYAWTPTSEVAARARVMGFARAQGIEDYWELLRRSTDEPEWFWDAIVHHLGIEFAVPYHSVLDASRGPEWPTWFVGGRLNAAWNCVGRWAAATPDAVAVSSETEDGAIRELTYLELWQEVCRLADGLSSLGIEAGDRVALYLPMLAEGVIATHACALIGAVQVPLFSGLAANAISARLVDGEVKAAITADGALRRGQVHRLKKTLDAALVDSPSVEHVIVQERFADEAGSTISSDRDVRWDDLVAGQSGEREREAFDSEHPYCLVYTSGTTGRPKGVVHATAGLLVKIGEECAFQTDVGQRDRLYWVTDLGWIMGAVGMMVGGGVNGATVVACRGRADRADPTASGASASAIASPCSASLRRSSESSCRTARSRCASTTSRPFGSSPRAASRGIPSPTAGSPPSSATADGRSSTSRAGPRSAPASSPRRRRSRSRSARVGAPSLGMAVDVVRRRGRVRPRRDRRTRLPQALAGR